MHRTPIGMSALDYLGHAARLQSLTAESFPEKASIRLITNFTDTVLGRLLSGLALEANIYPNVESESYKNYHFMLAGETPEYAASTDLTVFVFDANPYLANEFTSDETHVADILEGIDRYARTAKGSLLAATIPTPTCSAYANLFAEDPIYNTVKTYNDGLRALSKTHTNLSILETDRLVARAGESDMRDMRGMYAFDMPYTNEYSLLLAHEAMNHLMTLRGRIKKCIVVDLDNTLWGGVLGEVGVDGIELGPGYPGLAFENLQRVLKSYTDRGILLAIASRNNEADIDEVFMHHPHMQLRKEDFSSIQVNWGAKSESLRAIAEELSIGLDSLVFIDDDPVNREEVRAALPMVAVPELPTQPERYASILLSLPGFNQLGLTDEDRQKNEMYRQERARQALQANEGTSYLARLGITVAPFLNDERHDTRLAQLAQKTNQFNLTTHRYSEADLAQMRKDGAYVVGAQAEDRFGNYGIIALAVVIPGTDGVAKLDTFLMSCRAIGRGIEHAILDQILRSMKAKGYHTITASFIETAKNTPVRGFLPSAGFETIESQGSTMAYSRSLDGYPDDVSQTASDALSSITLSESLP